MTNIWLNVALAIVGLSALLLTLFNNRWGAVVGLFSQPLWFLVGWRSKAYSICVLAFAYAAVWGVGIWRGFKREKTPSERYEDWKEEIHREGD